MAGRAARPLLSLRRGASPVTSIELARDNLRGVETTEDMTIGSKSEYVNEPKPVEPMEHQGETGLVYGYCYTAHPSVDWERWVWPMSGGVTRGLWHWPSGRVSSNYRIVVSAVEL